MRYPNLVWAISQWGPRYKFAASIGESESWLSRRLGGRVEISVADRDRITGALSYPSDWLFEIPSPPKLATSR
jgi:transcriptional regulator with XRE-family HTH domain